MFIKLFKKFWPQIFIFIVISAFFARLFFPKPSIFVTPDYGRSDAWHLSIANKYYYAQELKKNRIPIWNPNIGMGFPTLAEGQTGIFFLPNLILFRFLLFVYAYNLNIVLTFLLAAFGTYLFCRSLTLNKTTSSFAGIIFALGGFFVVHVQHLHLIQTAAILPWLFWTSNEFFKHRKIIYLLALSFFLSQQIFAGFPQLVFYGLVALSFYLMFKVYESNFAKFKLIIIFIFFIMLGFALSAIQIIPTYELLKISVRENNPKNILTQFPYKIKNLLQFAEPYILGSPKDGSYPKWIPDQWGIYWESIAYIGILPLSFAIAVGIANPIKKSKYKRTVYIFSFLTLLSILLALGATAPLHPIFSFPPFSIFRVPSRFLLITQFSLVILASVYLQKSAKRKLLLGIVISLSIANLFYVFFNYNPLALAKQWFTEPSTAKILKEDQSGRIVSLGQNTLWNESFFKGWKDTNYYFFARNSLDQNSNLIFDINQLGAYESIPTRRSNLLISLVSKDISEKNNEYKIASSSARTLASVNVSHIISTLENNDQEFKKISETEKYKNYNFKILKNKTLPRRIFMTSQYKTAQTVGELTEKFSSVDFDPRSEIILEKEPNVQNLGLSNWNAKILSETPTNIKIKTESKGNGFLVLADSFYPGWEAYVDGTKTQVFAANINSRAVFVPEGIHQIIFKYQSGILYLSLTISIIVLALIIFLYLKLRNFKIT